MISAYEYVLALSTYFRELNKLKNGRASEPTEPIRRSVNVGRNPFISSFERREVIWSLFWLEQFNSLEYLSFRDIRPHAAILGRQCLELIWRDVIGFREIVDPAGNRLNQFTQVAWKFISSYKAKNKDLNEAIGTNNSWTITLPIPIRVIDYINTWCNSFTHEPFINMIHVQWYVVNHLQILTQPVNKNTYFTTKHSEIYIDGLRPMRREFEEFVMRQKSSAYVNWQPESYDEGAFIKSLGQDPSNHLLKKIRLKLICKNIRNIIKSILFRNCCIIPYDLYLP